MVFPLDPRGVYRVSLPDDTAPRARLCIAPRAVGKMGQGNDAQLSFFDSIRERVVAGKFVKDIRAPSDAVCFQVKDGARMWLEPMTLARWGEIRDLIDGRPEFQTEGELRAFYLRMVE